MSESQRTWWCGNHTRQQIDPKPTLMPITFCRTLRCVSDSATNCLFIPRPFWRRSFHRRSQTWLLVKLSAAMLSEVSDISDRWLPSRPLRGQGLVSRAPEPKVADPNSKQVIRDCEAVPRGRRRDAVRATRPRYMHLARHASTLALYTTPCSMLECVERSNSWVESSGTRCGYKRHASSRRGEPCAVVRFANSSTSRTGVTSNSYVHRCPWRRHRPRPWPSRAMRTS